MDFANKLKYTLKGPSSMGGKNARSMSIKYRGIHPSYIGRIDLNVCGTSDPGASGSLSPFADTDGLYFESIREREDGVFDIEKEIAIFNKRLEEINGFTIDYLSDCETVEEKLEREQKLIDRMKSITIKKIINDGEVIEEPNE